jgi:RNA polymerase sigma-70 factor (ECF subfamily)
VLYLLFNEGYVASTGDDLIRLSLCDEALRLARALCQLMPDEPEAAGLLALMLLQHSRRAARVDALGDLVPLDEQDRELWDRAQIEQAVGLLDAAMARGSIGPYQLQAAIAALHAQAPHPDLTDWRQIAELYAALERLMPSPVVRLNRAVAVAMAGDPDAGLVIVDQLAVGGALDQYHLLEATRAYLLRRRGDVAAAAAAYELALALAPGEPERRFLTRRLLEARGA